MFLRLRGLRGISLLLIRLRYPYASASSNSGESGANPLDRRDAAADEAI